MTTIYLGVQNPFPIFIDPKTNQPVEAGYIYVGTANYDAEDSPINIYWDSTLQIDAAQPVRTITGYPSRNGTPANFFVNALSYSITVKDKNKNVIFRNINVNGIPSAILDEDDFASDDATRAPSQQSTKAFITSGVITMTNKILDYTSDSKGTFKGIQGIVYRVSASSIINNDDPLGATGGEWEISDDTKNEFYLGSSSQITESSGIFSFAETGFYLIMFDISVTNPTTADTSLYVALLSTTDNSSYDNLVTSYASIAGSLHDARPTGFALIKVTDIANHKVKLKFSVGHADSRVAGNGSANWSAIAFIKIADI